MLEIMPQFQPSPSHLNGGNIELPALQPLAASLCWLRGICEVTETSEKVPIYEYQIREV
jgi:hypothetical protein